MRFKSLFESADDHEYWASMPHDHLHAETNRTLSSHGLSRVETGKWMTMWSGKHVDRDHVRRDLAQHGWTHHSTGPGEHQAEIEDIFEHPSGVASFLRTDDYGERPSRFYMNHPGD